jgi:hypothetical protein
MRNRPEKSDFRCGCIRLLQFWADEIDCELGLGFSLRSIAVCVIDGDGRSAGHLVNAFLKPLCHHLFEIGWRNSAAILATLSKRCGQSNSYQSPEPRKVLAGHSWGRPRLRTGRRTRALSKVRQH